MKKIALIMIVLFFAFSECPSNVMCNTNIENVKSNELFLWYDDLGNIKYPINCMSAEWKQLSYEAIYDKCNLPKEILESISTENLLNLILDYPEIFVICEASFTEGFANFRKNFNGISEFFKRDNCIEVLVDTYRNFIIPINPRHRFSSIVAEEGDDIDLNRISKDELMAINMDLQNQFSIMIMELMLSQPEVQNNADKVTKEEIERVIDEKNEVKKTSSMIFAPCLYNYDDNTTISSEELIKDSVSGFTLGSAGLIAGTPYDGISDYTEYSASDVRYYTMAACARYLEDFTDAHIVFTASEMANCHGFAWLYSNECYRLSWARYYLSSQGVIKLISSGHYFNRGMSPGLNSIGVNNVKTHSVLVKQLNYSSTHSGYTNCLVWSKHPTRPVISIPLYEIEDKFGYHYFCFYEQTS